ncbi:MAG: hypothetical protein MRQ13_05420 [Candidatus Midichloria sp.]|nr:hypothetical protein [Candidatus Midichloria sp.]
MYNIHTLDAVIIVLYFLVCIGVVLYKYRSVTTLKEYALGGITEYYRILTQLPTEMKTLNFTQENIGLFFKPNILQLITLN